MQLVSDEILIDSGQIDPTYPAIYPKLEGFELANPASWTSGHPFDFYRRLREEAPVHWTPGYKAFSGFWSVSRYEDIKTVELAPHVFSSQRGSINIGVARREDWKPKKLVPAAFNSLINLDAPHHMEMRIQQKDFFIPAYVAKIRDRVAAHIDGLLDEMERQGPEVDFVKMFSEQVPLFTLCEMLGVDEADRPKIVHWMHYLEMASMYTVNKWQVIMGNPLFPFRFFKAVNEMFAYGEQVMADRKAHPREDLLTVIAQSKLDGEELSQEYLDGSWLLIIFAGNDTTRNSLTGTIQLMHDFPDQRQMVLDDPSLIPRMSQEALRLVSPVKHMRRTALEDFEINGQKIAKDEKVAMWYGAANRDPDVFPEPDTFDMMRENIDKHLAFGHGVHKCLGARIAQMQLRLSYEKIFERFPNIAPVGKVVYAPNALVNAMSSLKVNLYGAGGQRAPQVQVQAAE
ncbi:MAG: cytochrome P450 [Henriciella sp.]|nr:cytochrome P450 [Henriciella sp.]